MPFTDQPDLELFVYLLSSSKVIIFYIQVIDDSLFESPEEFELRLSDSSYNARIGTLSSATVIIDGPNDGKGSKYLQLNNKKRDLYATV